jgi:hypothetical protein
MREMTLSVLAITDAAEGPDEVCAFAAVAGLFERVFRDDLDDRHEESVPISTRSSIIAAVYLVDRIMLCLIDVYLKTKSKSNA